MIDQLTRVPALSRPELLAPAVVAALRAWDASGGLVEVTEIDPDVADTAAFCERYGVAADESANCVVVAARRGGEQWLAACVVLASTRADVNGLVRRHLGARKVSFAPMELAVAETGMEYGGITPIGLPANWPLLVDAGAAATDRVIIGSGIRASKLVMPGALLAALPKAEILENLAT
jgi:prolyl-tRNA editing enzyme YbaK/EbsC (Cys-tRNA(Pro) deacylase)